MRHKAPHLEPFWSHLGMPSWNVILECHLGMPSCNARLPKPNQFRKLGTQRALERPLSQHSEAMSLRTSSIDSTLQATLRSPVAKTPYNCRIEFPLVHSTQTLQATLRSPVAKTPYNCRIEFPLVHSTQYDEHQRNTAF